MKKFLSALKALWKKKSARIGAVIFAVLLIGCLVFFFGGPYRAMRIERVISAAEDQLGRPYIFGTAGPESFDCSGLVRFCFAKIGIELVHSAQWVGYDDAFLKIESADELERGDLIFFNTVSDSDLCDHVGIWLGENRFIHASSGKEEVMISELNDYFSDRFSWGRRIF